MMKKAPETDNTISETIGQVISADGTAIGYRQYGNGAGLILVHGGMATSKNFSKLATELSDVFTVIVPDRRGRGLSGKHGDNYCLATECEDIQALVEMTGAEFIFGLSSGAIVALQSAFTISTFKKVALYEPPLSINGSISNSWRVRYEQELKQGKLAMACVTILKATGDMGLMSFIPRFILILFINLAMKAQPQNDDIQLKALIPTFHYDSQLVTETEEKVDRYKDLQAEVLLLGGNRSRSFLKIALDKLSKILPHSRRVTFKGVGHLAADNSGKPKLVAEELKQFFGR